MSNNWGDYNGDGRTDYVDYKIYTTQVDPGAGNDQNEAYRVMQEYQNQHYYQTSGNKLSSGEWAICFVAALVVLCVVLFLDIEAELAGLLGMLLIIVFAVIFAVFKNKNRKK